MRALFKKLFVLTLLVAVLAAVAGGLAWRHFQAFSTAPLLVPEGATLVVSRGDSFVQVLAKLRAVGISEGHDLEWKLLAMQMEAMPRLQVGEYALQDTLSPRELLEKLVRGDVIRYRFTLVEGWSMRDLRAALARSEVLADDVSRQTDEALMASLGRKGTPAEGRFLPETYTFVRGDSASHVLGQAADAMDRALAEAWSARAADVPLRSPEELLTLASIVEKETGQASERPEIAGVFARRLKVGMRLQTDPTVIYGLGAAFDGNLRRRDLQTDTPFNTYTRFGLPPTPIAMPGRAALSAAANPLDGETFYFVARGDGHHVFSKTYAEHQKAVRRYQLGQR